MNQIFRAKWLLEPALHAPVARCDIRGSLFHAADNKQLHVVKLVITANLFDTFGSMETRHLHVHHHRIRLLMGQVIKCCLTVFGGVDFKATGSQVSS